MNRPINFHTFPVLFAGGLVLGAFSAKAQRALTEIPDPDPMYQRSLLGPAEGFDISLYASEPMIAKPTAMAFDSKGRLFVTCTPIYPHVKPGVLPSDQVVRLEDTDGDGKADKSTVFADGLLIPTAVLANPEGVYVGNSTELLFFTDEDDDGVADSKRTLYSGFGTEDTHHIIHTLRQGPAGRITFNQSVYTHSHVETPYGYRDLQAGGVWRFRPETLELEVYARGMWNSWGFQYDLWGQTFQSDGAGSEGIGHSFPGAAFVRAVGYDRFLNSMNPGQPKFSGLEVIDSPHFPADWQGRLITCDFRGNRISSFKVSDSNSGFISRKDQDLVTSTHGAFRPIDVQLGPDGALYVADWYNPIIQHGEVDFRDERRDHTHGRIWRITAKNRALNRMPDFYSASVSELLQFLKSSDAWTRDHARRQLKFRGADAVLPQLDNWIKNLDRGQDRYDEFVLAGLWVSQSLDSVNRTALDTLLKSNNFKARAAAVRVLEERPKQHPELQNILQQAIVDDAPRVRNEAIQVLRKWNTREASKLVVKVLDKPMDEILDFSLWNALRELKPIWLPAAQNDPRFFGDKLDYLLFAIRSVDDPEAIQPLEARWKSGAVGEKDRIAALVLLAERGSPSTLQLVVDEALKLSQTSADGIPEILDALTASAARRKVQPAQGQDSMNQLLQHESPAVQSAAAALTGQWKLKSAVPHLKSITADPDTASSLRDKSVAALVAIGSPESRSALADLAKAGLSKTIRIAVASGYARADPKKAVPLVAELLSGLEPNENGVALIDPYIAKPELPIVLANGLSGNSIHPEVATVLLRRVSTSSIDTGDLQAALQNAAGIKPVNQNLNAEEMKAMMDFVETYGDAARGELVYRRDALLCMTCHAIGGAGGSLGPDLTSIGASAPMDYLIDSLLNPQKQIKEGFHVVMITRKDGTVVAGKLASQNESTITLQDVADQLIVISKSDVASQTMSPISLMPPGLTSSLRKDEFADLVKFMSRLGKEGDFKVSANRYVRTFRYLDDKGGDLGYADLVRHKPMVHVTSDDPQLIWLPGYSMTNGFIPLDELPSLRRQGRESYYYVRFHLDAKNSGDVILRVNDPEEMILFVDGKEIESVSSDTRITLKQGINQIIAAVQNLTQANKMLRFEVLDAPDNSAQVQIIYGK